MRKWEERPPETKYLLNPAFCSRLLYAAIFEYESKSGRPMPFPLIYLILPLVLHKRTREKINSVTKLLNWTQANQELLLGFPARAKGLVEITNESIEFLLCSGIAQLTDTGEIIRTPRKRKLSEADYLNEEIKQCIWKSKHVARWFIGAGTTENVYACLGVRL